MLREEIEQYTNLTGEDGWHVPIMKVGAYLDGYNKGLEVIDRVRAEIEQARYVLVNDGLDMALNIIDKYKAKGAPLPKGHTELVDRQIIADYVHSHIQEINTGYGDLNQHTNRILRMIENYIDNAPTIIEADKESEVDNV
jgi:hypothetical protein